MNLDVCRVITTPSPELQSSEELEKVSSTLFMFLKIFHFSLPILLFSSGRSSNPLFLMSDKFLTMFDQCVSLTTNDHRRYLGRNLYQPL